MPKFNPLHRRTFARSLGCGALLILTLGATSATAKSASPRDPIEGKWLGDTGGERERIEIGLEFIRGDDGVLQMKLTQPVSNYYGVDPGGTVERNGDRVTYPTMHLDLQLKDDTLVGFYPGPNSSAILRRVQRLPQAPKPPRVSAGPEPRWETRLNGQVRASPVVFGDTIYIGSSGGVFNAVDARDGKILWTFATGCPIHGSAAVDLESVFVACDTEVFRLTRSNGTLAWRYALATSPMPRVLPHPQVFEWDWQAPTPLIADDTVYIGAGDGGFHAVDTASGTRRWRFDTRAAIRTGAVLDGERIVFGSKDKFVYALDRTSGRERWRFDTGAPVDTTPVVHDGRVLVGNRGTGLFALNAESGEPDWRLFFWGSWVESTPVVVDDFIYIGSSDLRRISAIDPANGRVQWRTDVFGWSFGTPLIVGDRIHVGAAGGAPYFIPHLASYTVLDRATGRMLSRRPLPDGGGNQWGIVGSLAQAGDTIVFATLGGSLFGFPMD